MIVNIDSNDLENATPTPAGSGLSKRNLPASTPIYSNAVIPYLGALGTPFVKGLNVTDFLDRNSRICTDYRVNDQEKIKRLFWYCEMFTGKYIETLISSCRTSWVALWKILRVKYKLQHLNHRINSRRFLERYKDKTRFNTSDILQYCPQFSAISQNLVGKGKLDFFSQSCWFLQGLPSNVQTGMFNRY